MGIIAVEVHTKPLAFSLPLAFDHNTFLLYGSSDDLDHVLVVVFWNGIRNNGIHQEDPGDFNSMLCERVACLVEEVGFETMAVSDMGQVE